MAKVEKVCPICGTVFLGATNKTYCFPKCQKQAYINKEHEKSMSKYPLHRICPICGKEFIIDDPIHKSQKFCSEECRKKGNIKNAHKSYNKRILNEAFGPDAIAGYDYVVCPICGEKHYQITMTHFKRHGIKSREELFSLYPDLKMTCQRLIDENLVGDNNPIKKLSKTERQECSPNSIKHYLKMYNNDIEKAQTALLEFQKKNHEKQKVVIQGTNPLYYINQGYTEEEVRQIIHDKYATNGLERYIKKYGEIEGPKRYRMRMQAWSKSALKGLTHSQVADKCINDIIAHDSQNKKLYYGDNEYTLYSPLTKKYYKLDLINFDTLKVIEFFGDYWHCNPRKYKADFYNKNSEKTAQEIWNYDNNKIESIKYCGYDVMIIWEYDYVHDTDNVIAKAREFLFNK